MDQSNALNRLLEAADLLKMVEDLTSPGGFERLSGSSVSGLRITIRNIRESVLASHDQLAGNFVNKAKVALETRSNGELAQQNTSSPNPITSQFSKALVDIAQRNEVVDRVTHNLSPSDPQRTQMTRRDLRASLEKMVDR